MTASNADKIAATENTSPNTKVNGVASPSKEERWIFIIGKFYHFVISESDFWTHLLSIL